MEGKNLPQYFKSIVDQDRCADGTLIGYYEKHEYRDVETGAMYDFG